MKIYLGKPADDFASGAAKVMFIEHGEEVCENDSDLQFGKSHTEARMPTLPPLPPLSQVPKLYFLILSPFGKVTGRIPLLQVRVDSGTVVNMAKMIRLVEKDSLVNQQTRFAS